MDGAIMNENNQPLSEANKNTVDEEPRHKMAPSRRTALQTAGVAGLGLLAASAAMVPRTAEASSAAMLSSCKLHYGALPINSATTTVALNTLLGAFNIPAGSGMGWIIIGAFTPNCEIRRIISFGTTISTITGTSISVVTFSGPLLYTHPQNDTVLWSEKGDNDVTLFGAKGDATTIGTDDSTAINRAVLSASQDLSVGGVPVHAGSRIVNFPKAAYRILSSIVVNADDITLIGNDSTINLDNPALSHFIVGNNSVARKGIRIDGFFLSCLNNSPIATGGAAITMGFTAGVIISNCKIYGKQRIYNGIFVSRGIENEVHNCSIQDCVNSGVALVGTGVGGNKTNYFVLASSHIAGCAVAGFSTGQFVEGVYVRDTVFYNNQNHVVVNGGSINTGCVSYKFLNCDFDTTRYPNPPTPARPGGYGIKLQNVSNVQICGSWFSNNERENVVADGTVFELVITGNQLLKNLTYIPQLIYEDILAGNTSPPPTTVLATTWNVNIGAQSVVISGNLVKGGSDCIILQATAKVVTITGNQISGNIPAPSYTTNLGVNKTANPDRVTIIGNTFAYLISIFLANPPISSGGTNVAALAGTNVVA
jgi:hypothetical protein